MNSPFCMFYLFLSLCVSLSISVLSHPKNLQSVKELDDLSPFKIALKTPSMHDLLYLKHLAHEKGQQLETSPLKTHVTIPGNSKNVNDVVVHSYANTFIYGTVYWGTPPQKFTVIFDSGAGDTYLVNNTGCSSVPYSDDPSRSCQKDWPNRFDPKYSLTYSRERAGNIADFSHDIFQLEGCPQSVISQFFLFNGNLMGPKASYLVKLPYVPEIDGFISFGFFDKSGAPIKDLVMQMKSKIVSLWLGFSRRLDVKEPVEAVLTIGGVDKLNCKNTWQFVKALPSPDDVINNYWRMHVNSQFGTDVVTNREAYFFWDSMYISVPLKHLKDLYGKTEPFYPDGTSPNSIKCKGGAARKGLPNLKLTIGVKDYEITPQHYIIDVAPEIDLCHLLLTEWSDKFLIGQPFLNSFCTAFDYTEGDRKIGLALKQQI